MAILEWDESISMHIPHIDQQHKGLIDWINKLDDGVLHQGNQPDLCPLHP